MKRKRISRMLAVLLAFTMVFTMMPAMVWADTGTGTSKPVTAYWPNFRGNDSNMAIVDAQTPIDKNKTSTLWCKKISSGWDYPSPPIIAGDNIYVTSGTNIYKINKSTGEILKTGSMAESQGYASATPPVYAEGKIIVALTGKIQAFDSETLESLWVYSDDLGGQCQSPLTYNNGCVYTGFYNRGNANFVCIDISCEDVTEGVKSCKWKYTGNCDYYWAGAAIVGNAVIVGNDKNELLSLNKENGEVITKITDIAGQIKSTIAYVQSENRIYFTAKGGYIYKASVNPSTGVISDVMGKIPSADGTDVISDSTSTPVVYKGKVYFTGGTGRTNPGYLCIVSADDLSLVSKVEIGINPQCSILLSTAYEDTGYLYLYSTYNNNPGGITMIKVPTTLNEQNQPEAADLFIPESDAQQFCVCSVICDENGTLYYKNDSQYLFAVNLNENAVAEKKAEAIALLATYSETNYYETQWSEITAIKTDATDKITAATTINEINTVLTAAKKKIDAIETKSTFEEKITINVTFADKGEIVTGSDTSKTLLADEAVEIADTNSDGKHTVDEALIQIHEKFCSKGSDGYKKTMNNEYGYEYISEFWGIETSAVGYYVNDVSAMGLTDSLKSGDYFTAFIYKDQTGWSDAYTRFDKNVYSVNKNNGVTLTLTELKYGTPEEPCSGASIKVIGSNNSIKPVYTTDANGQVTLKFEAAGTYKVMAYKDDGSIVPSAATITVTESDVPPAVQENAKVTFTLKGDTLHSGTLHSGTYYPTWIFATTVDLTDEVKTVGDVFKQVLDANKYTYVGLEKGYISTITTPDGFSLSEFDNGKDSGWMYTVNGSHPNVGLNNYALSDGDVVVWHYTDNYKEEPDYAVPSTPDVSTSGSSGSATTTTSTQVVVKDDTATATVKDENAKEIIRQAAENKSKEIVINVKQDDTKTAEKVQVEIQTDTAKEVVEKTEAALIVSTPNGSVTLTQDAIKEAVAEAKGKTIIIEVSLVSKPTEIQQSAAGTNGHIIAVTIKSDGKTITTFGGKSLTIKSEIPAKLNGKTVIAIHIADDGKIEKMTGKVVTENGKDFYEFETPHLSTFALADADEVKIDEPEQDKPSQDEADKAAEQKAKIKKVKTTVTLSTKGIKKGIKVTVKVPESKKADKTGIIIYRSTSKNAKPYAVYKKVSTKGSTYTIRNTKNVKGKKLTKGKTYYYKARAYKVINGKTYYGPMSTIKSIKAK